MDSCWVYCMLLNFSSSIVSEYRLLTMVASFVFFNGLPNWTLASYCFLMGSRIGYNHQLVIDHYLLPHKDLEFAVLCCTGQVLIYTSCGCSLSLMPADVSSLSEISLTSYLFDDWRDFGTQYIFWPFFVSCYHPCHHTFVYCCCQSKILPNQLSS